MDYKIYASSTAMNVTSVSKYCDWEVSSICKHSFPAFYIKNPVLALSKVHEIYELARQFADVDKKDISTLNSRYHLSTSI